MALYKYPGSSRQTAPTPTPGITEFEILKASHKFLRDEDERPTTWDEKLAGKYYSNLYREFAVCDLKHYKSGNFALRWRTEEEVLDGSGETTCGNTRCEYHYPSRFSKEQGKETPLTTLELPFAYMEQGEAKSALVKVVLCAGCVKKLMWKRTKEKEKGRGKQKAGEDGADEAVEVKVKVEEKEESTVDMKMKMKTKTKEELKKRKRRLREEEDQEQGDENENRSYRRQRQRRRQSRSRSPRRTKEDLRAR